MQVVKAQAESHRCSAVVDWMETKEPYYPPTINDKATYEFAADVGRRYNSAWLTLLPEQGLQLMLDHLNIYEHVIQVITYLNSLTYTYTLLHTLIILRSILATYLACRLQGDFLEDYEPTLGGEDFSFYGHAGVPAAFSFLGIRNETAGSVHGLHTPRFMLDEEVLQTGAAFLASLASEYLSQHQTPLGKEEL